MRKTAFKLYYHLVFSTKCRDHLFDSENYIYLKEIIVNKCKANNYVLLSVGIQSDHVHLLLSLKTTDCIPKVVKNLKGYSSYELNKTNLFRKKLIWQRGYGIDTVSKNMIAVISRYIQKQSSPS